MDFANGSDNGRNHEHEISPTDKRALVKRVSASSHLNKSPRLTQLLEYLTECSLNGSAEGIHEREIGTSVFDRQENYDTSQDNIVRVQVGHLRRKIERYFATDGIDEPLILEIPKGGYVPIFYLKLPSELPGETHSSENIAAGTRAPNRYYSIDKRVVVVSVFVGVALLIGCLVLLARNRQLNENPRHKFESSRALNSLWSRILVKDQRTDIVLADSVLALFQDKLGRHLTLQEYVQREYATKVPDSFPEKERNELLTIVSRRYTSIADVNLLARIIQFSDFNEQMTTISLARDYQVRGLKTHNVILFGSKRTNPWVETFEEQMNFRFVYTELGPRPSIQNKSPKPDEQPVYSWPGEGKGYAIVAFLPNIDRTGNVLIVQGEDMVSTEAAGEFVTDESSFSKFLDRLAAESPRLLDPLTWFEVLLATKKVESAARSVEIVAFRTLAR